MDWYLGVLKNKYAEFTGRARRTEYWMFALFNLLASMVLGVVDRILFRGHGILGGLYSLAVLIPSIAVSIRRLHDTGRSGWWLLLAFVPILGWIALLIFAVQDSQPGANAYGPNPKEQPAPASGV